MNESINYVAQKLGIKENQVEVVLQLLAEGATIPFISRYRKNLTQGLDEEIIAQIDKIFQYNVELNKKKESIRQILRENKLLSPELDKLIEDCDTKSALDAIYEPYKIGKKTKATEAIEMGLEPLAKLIFNNSSDSFFPFNEAKKYINDVLKTPEEVIEKTKLIIAQWISQDHESRSYIKEQINTYGFIVTEIKKNAVDEKENFKNYYEFKEKIARIPDFRILAINRGEEEDVLKYNLEFNKKTILYNLNNKFFKSKTCGKIVYDSLEDALDRIIYPSINREIKNDLFKKAEINAINLFAQNLETLLLEPAIQNKVILSIDPAFVSGCKIAILDPSGKVLKIEKFYLTTSSEEKQEIYRKKLLDLFNQYSVDIVVIGNGTGSRETEKFISELIKKNNLSIKYTIVSEVGASVYSASKIAIEEFPNLSVEERSAINIGRKFQDALNEIVKIDPKSIGIGQYQHDLNQKELQKSLEFKVNKIVNLIGVDLNSATKHILTFISGLNNTVAKNIVDYRNQHGNFKNREELFNVKGMGDKAYNQSVGFLRIHDSDNFYDRTPIHPELYDLSDKFVKKLNLDLSNTKYKNILEKISENDLSKIANDLESNIYDIKLIYDSLLNPQKDIRDDKSHLELRSDILNFEDVKVGMQFKGKVTNITDFGAFIYFGLKESALVHISKITSSFIKHPSEKLSLNQEVDIEIIEIDAKNNKIKAKIIE